MKKTGRFFAMITLVLSFCMAFVVTRTVFSNASVTKESKVIDQIKLMQDSDVIFQTSQSAQCEAVRIATNSKFSHCGIIVTIDNEKMVLEAVQPVKLTKVLDWISHGKDNKFILKRLVDSKKFLTKDIVRKMTVYGQSFLNKDYDVYFNWSDSEIYCSELVWKIYKNVANIELCSLEKLKSFNLSDPKVKIILAKRYGNSIPLNEDVVAPSQLVASKLLKTVIDTY